MREAYQMLKCENVVFQTNILGDVNLVDAI